MKELDVCESEKKKIEAKYANKVTHTHEEEVKKAQELEHAMSRQQHGLEFWVGKVRAKSHPEKKFYLISN